MVIQSLSFTPASILPRSIDGRLQHRLHHTRHRIQSAGQAPVVYLSVDCFLGGRPADKPTWDSHVRALCQLNGWDYEQVRG